MTLRSVDFEQTRAEVAVNTPSNLYLPFSFIHFHKVLLSPLLPGKSHVHASALNNLMKQQYYNDLFFLIFILSFANGIYFYLSVKSKLGK